jgi:membrane dipeptidase
MTRAALAVFIAVSCLAQKRAVTEDEVRRVHQSTLLIDTHNDVTSKTVLGFDIGKRAAGGHTDLPRMREGGLGAQFFAVYVGANYLRDNHAANRALQMFDTVRHDIIDRYPNEFELALTADQIEAAHRKGKIAALMGVEGGHAIEDSLRILRSFHALGARYMTLTHSNTNNWADSSGDMERAGVKHHNGLTAFGRRVVREMNRLGMMVDVSHVADKTFRDVIETSKAPVFASHSSARAVSDIPRNMSDEMIQAVARKGGVVQINFGCDFVSQRYAGAIAPLRRKMAEALLLNPSASREEIRKMLAAERSAAAPATLADVVAHIDHVRKIAGVDSIGIGSDYDGVGCVPTGLEDVSKYPNLTRALLENGYTAGDIGKIYGGNLLRVMRAVEKAAERPAAPAVAGGAGKPPLLIDTHNDVTSFTLKGLDIGKPNPGRHTDVRRLRAGGAGATFFAAYVAASFAKDNRSAHRALEMIDTIRHDIVDRYPGDFELASSAAGIEAAHQRGKIAALIGIEGGHAIEDSPRLLRSFHALGVRYLTLTHTNTNGWADSSADAAKHNGLSPLGRQIIGEMNRLGMMVDVSHVSDQTFRDALEASKAPVIASHSSCRTLANVPRNLSDDMIKALAGKGGVIQINFNCGFLSPKTAAAESALEKKLGGYDEAAFRKAFASGAIPRATLADVVAHIDHAVKIGGIGAVGLGSDFDGIPCAPAGLDDVSRFPALARALAAKGYSNADIARIFGGNLLRVMREVEALAARLN